MSWWYHKRGGLCRPLPGGPYLPRVFEDPTCSESVAVVTVTWDDVEGKPDEFPPEAHTHVWSDIEDVPECFEPCDHTHEVGDIEGLNSDPLRDPSGAILRDPTGRALYPPGSIPAQPGHVEFDSVADMLAYPVEEWATGTTLGWSYPGDGSILFWRQSSDPVFVETGDSVLETDTAGVFAVRTGGQTV